MAGPDNGRSFSAVAGFRLNGAVAAGAAVAVFAALAACDLGFAIAGRAAFAGGGGVGFSIHWNLQVCGLDDPYLAGGVLWHLNERAKLSEGLRRKAQTCA